MNERCIRAVVSVAEHLSFSEAAYDLNYSVSAVSKQIAAFEQAVGFQVFERGSKSAVSLTPQGRQLLPDLRLVVASYDALHKHIEKIKNGEDDRLTIAFGTGSISSLNIEPLILTYLNQYPLTKVSLKTMKDSDAAEGIRQRKIDFFVAALPGDNPDASLLSDLLPAQELQIFPYERCQRSFAMSSRNPLAHKSVLRPQDLRRARIVHRKFEESLRMKAIIRQSLLALGRDPEKQDFEYIEDDKGKLILELVEHSNAIVPLLRRENMAGRDIVCIPFEGDCASICLCLVSRTGNESQSVRQFLEVARLCVQTGEYF